MKTPDVVTVNVDLAEILRAADEAVAQQVARGHESVEQEAFAKEVRTLVIKALTDAISRGTGAGGSTRSV